MPSRSQKVEIIMAFMKNGWVHSVIYIISNYNKRWMSFKETFFDLVGIKLRLSMRQLAQTNYYH